MNDQVRKMNTKQRILILLDQFQQKSILHFAKKRGRAGPHNQHHYNNNPIHFHSDTLIYVTMFNAGLRLYDISNVQQVKEIGYFIPPNPTHRDMVLPTEMVLQTEDVIVDKRGYAYISQKNDGIYIVQYTGSQYD